MLITCETTDRRARLIELDPKYVDVIVKRWQDYTGRKAVLESDGREFEQMALERFLPESNQANRSRRHLLSRELLITGAERATRAMCGR